MKTLDATHSAYRPSDELREAALSSSSSGRSFLGTWRKCWSTDPLSCKIPVLKREESVRGKQRHREMSKKKDPKKLYIKALLLALECRDEHLIWYILQQANACWWCFESSYSGQIRSWMIFVGCCHLTALSARKYTYLAARRRQALPPLHHGRVHLMEYRDWVLLNMQYVPVHLLYLCRWFYWYIINSRQSDNH